MYGQLIQAFNLKNTDILNVYPIGSRVYGTHAPNSDYDFVIVGNVYLSNFLGPNKDDTMLLSKNYAGKCLQALIYTTQSFSNSLKQHSVLAMECFYLPEDLVLQKAVIFNFNLDKKQLRNRVMQKAIYDWERFKTKFENGKTQKAKRSLFHSLRVLDFGLQIANTGKINDYTSCSALWKNIRENKSENGKDYKGLFQERFHDMLNRLITETTEIT